MTARSVEFNTWGHPKGREPEERKMIIPFKILETFKIVDIYHSQEENELILNIFRNFTLNRYSIEIGLVQKKP